MSAIAQAAVAHTKLLKKLTRQNLQISALQSLLAIIREVVAYVFLIGSVLADKLTIADFIFYIGIVTGVSGWMSGLSWQFVMLREVCVECGKYREFLEMPDRVRAERQVSFEGPAAFIIVY